MQALGGIHGINVIGGAPKVGKSTFLIQIGSEMALQEKFRFSTMILKMVGKISISEP